jgi:hypothetical protein
MLKNLYKNYWPHGLWILLFLLISASFFSPLISGKKAMFQHDIEQAEGMAHEIREFKEKTGENSLWTNSMFGGMPAYQIGSSNPNNWTSYIFSALTYLFSYDRYPITSLWWLMTCIFLLMVVLDINVWVAGALAVGYGFSTYNIIGIEAGHANKIWTLMYAPLILAGIELVFRRRLLSGITLTALGLAINIYANHIQITYYMFIAVLIWMLARLFFAFREKALKDFATASSFLLIAAIIGISVNASNLWTTYEYGKESTRGGSELSFEEGASEKGLSYGYVFDEYSYGRSEVLTFLIPNYSGGASAMDLPKDSEVAKLTRQTKGMPTYWGPQRYVAGPYYLGAIICFLMVFGILATKNSATKIWLIILSFLAVSLSMGKNSLFLSDLFYNYFPLYQKFRVPTIITGIIQMCFILLAGLGINELISNKENPVLAKKLHLSFLISGGICLLLALLGPAFMDFTSENDKNIPISDPDFRQRFFEALYADRASLMTKDAFRSFIFIGLTYLTLLGFCRKKLSLLVSSGLIATLLLADLWPVNKRYMNPGTYRNKKTEATNFVPSNADKIILQDQDPDYRVLNLSVSPFNDATTSYFHKSVGGYHGAKLRRYQDLIAYGISGEAESIKNLLRTQPDPIKMDSLQKFHLPVLNLLNTKYIILNPEGMPLPNEHARGHAWFANEIRWAENADEEILSVTRLNNLSAAVIRQTLKDETTGLELPQNSSGTIRLKSYAPNHLVYESESANEELAVFSEIYYPYGWKATIDGKEADHFRCNYVLRCMRVPAGKHVIEYSFQPESYIKGEKISLAGSICLLLLCLGSAGASIRNLLRKKAGG